MKLFLLTAGFVISVSASAQKERDTVLNHCPLFITDTVSANNFFLERQPSTIKVYRTKGDLTIAIEQREQLFTIFFGVKNLDDKKYTITGTPDSKKDVLAKYSFHAAGQVSYVNMTSGTIETSYDKQTKLWIIKVNGLLANYVGQSITYFRVKADFSIP